MSHVSCHNIDSKVAWRPACRLTHVIVSVTVGMLGVHIEMVIRLTVGIVIVAVTGGRVGGVIVIGATVGSVTVTVTVGLFGVNMVLKSVGLKS